jgi:hypothetical protein
MSFFYFIHKNLPAESNDLPAGPRISRVSDKFKIKKMEETDGPFTDIPSLKKESKIYRELLRINPKRAEIIFKEKYIVEPERIILFPANKNTPYAKNIYRLMQHSLNGSIYKKNVLGIHLLNPNRINIIEITKQENEKGIWEAKIEVLNTNSGKWIEKERATFFPRGWDLQKLIIECEVAFNNKRKVSETKYIGYTKENIPIVFIFSKENELKTVYPLYE